MRSCVAVGCSNRQLKSSPISFHEFPADVEKRLEWIKNVRRKEWTPGDRAVLCSEHFTSDCFYTSVSGRKFLKKDSFPTIFKGSNKRLQRRIHPAAQPRNISPTKTQEKAPIVDPYPSKLRHWYVELDHSYSANIPPEVANEKLKCERDQNYKLRKKIEGLQKQLKRNEKALNDAVKLVAQSRKTTPSEVEQLVQESSGKLPMEILKRYSNKTNNPDTVRAYPESLKDFAMKLHLCSPKAYRLVRESFQLSLPSESIIKKWSGKAEVPSPILMQLPDEVMTKKRRKKIPLKKGIKRRTKAVITEQRLDLHEVLDFDGQDKIELYTKDGFDVDEFLKYQGSICE